MDILPSLDLKQLPTQDTKPNGTIDVRDFRLCPSRPEGPNLVEDDAALDHAQEYKQARRNVHVIVGKQLVGGQVSPDGVGDQRRQGLMCAKGKVVRESAKDGERNGNLYSIPAMSTELKRVFSHSKLRVTLIRNSLSLKPIETPELLRYW